MELKNLNVLVIDDNKTDRVLLKENLKDVGNFGFHEADCMDAGIKLLNTYNYDIVFLDILFPEKNSKLLEIISPYKSSKIITELNPNASIIMLTGVNDFDVAFNLMDKENIQDYIIKDDLCKEILKRSIIYSLERKRRYPKSIESNREVA